MWIVVVFISVQIGFGPRNCHAQGVSVAPLRVLFDGRTRSATVFLSNRTSTTGTYRISLENRRMLQDGNIVVADEAQDGEYFADEFIRFSPRRVTIAPYGSQTVRLLVRRPRGDYPEDVEFRTHMSIRSIPPTPRLEDLESQEKLVAEGKLAVQAVASVETVIPIILRFGDPDASVAIANPSLDLYPEGLKNPMLSIDLLRGGERSIYGQLDVLHIAPDGKEETLYFARGLAVYSPTTLRNKSILLKGVDAELLNSGSLLISYTESADMHGDESAELVIPLGPGGILTQ
jgi:hypothetical protein